MDTPIIELKQSSERGFGRGERVILVDGIQWGRTRVEHHGPNGTSHTFEQEGGEVIIDKSDVRYPQYVKVRTGRRGRLGRSDRDWRPTEEMVLEKVGELIANGKLRHPDIVRAEQQAAREQRRHRDHEAAKAKDAAFESKAREALMMPDNVIESEMLDRVVAAMKWAQEQ